LVSPREGKGKDFKNDRSFKRMAGEKGKKRALESLPNQWEKKEEGGAPRR